MQKQNHLASVLFEKPSSFLVLFHAPARGFGDDNDDDDDARETPGRLPARPLVSLRMTKGETERRASTSDALPTFSIDAPPLSPRAPSSFFVPFFRTLDRV